MIYLSDLPVLPFPELAGTAGTSYAAYPVWKDSTTKEVKFLAVPKRIARSLYHRAREFDRQTKKGDGCHGGAVGPTALQVFHTLTHDFLNYTSGRLDPSYEAIARKANLSVRAVATALQRLKQLGLINWVRRCAEKWENGRYILEQDTNAYAVLPTSQWLGYQAPPEAPPPQAGTWGDHPPLPSLLEQASAESKAGGTLLTAANILDADPSDALAMALARLGRTMHERKTQ